LDELTLDGAGEEYRSFEFNGVAHCGN